MEVPHLLSGDPYVFHLWQGTVRTGSVHTSSLVQIKEAVLLIVGMLRSYVASFSPFLFHLPVFLCSSCSMLNLTYYIGLVLWVSLCIQKLEWAKCVQILVSACWRVNGAIDSKCSHVQQEV